MPSPVYFTVTADFKAFVEDASSDADYNPQEVPISATVTFTPLFNSGDVALATTATPRPIGYLPTPVVAVIDSADGRLKLRTTADAGGTGTFAPVRLLGSSSFLELDGPLYYEVSFSNVTYNGNRTSIAGFTFEAPSSDIDLNLITVMRKPGEVASGINKISPGGVRVEGNTLVFTFDGADIPDPLPLSNFVGPAGSISVGTVTTGAAYSSATIENVGTPQAAVLNFTVPQGVPGATNTAPDTHNAQSKTTPVDADEMPLADSASSYGLKKLTWANLKAAVATYYNSLTATMTNKTISSPTIAGSATSISFGAFTNLQSTESGDTGYVITGSASRYPHFSAAPKYAWHDVLRFNRYWGTPTYETYSGGTWTAQTLNSQLFAGKEDTMVTLADGTTVTAVRWTWDFTGKTGSSSNVRYWMFGPAYSNPAALNTYFVESSADGVTWTARGTVTPADAALSHVFVTVNGSGSTHTKCRLTITATNAKPIALSYIRALTCGISGQAGGVEYEYPYDWDKDRNITLPANLTVTGTTTLGGAAALTTSGSATVTNKTISGASNTITNLPASATPDAARLVCKTAVGAATTETGANTWAKIATFNTGADYIDANVLLAVTTSGYLNSPNSETAIIAASLTTGGGRTPTVSFLGKSGYNRFIGPDSFKIVSNTASGVGVAELWVKKLADYGQLSFFELARSMYNVTCTVTYNDGAAWQSAAPTGTAFNVVSDGVYAFNVPVVTTTGTQALSNKTLTSPKASLIYDTGGGIAWNYTAIASAVNYWSSSSGPAGTGISLMATGSDTNINGNIWSKGTGDLNLRSTTNGVGLVVSPSTGSGANYLKVTGTEANTAPSISAMGSDTNISINAVPKGTGTLNVSGVPVVTTATGARQVVKTLTGGSSGENGANTWAKLVTLNPSANDSAHLLLGITTGASFQPQSAVISVYAYAGQPSPTLPTVAVQIVGYPNSGYAFYQDAFKLVNNGYGQPVELWIKKSDQYTYFKVTEISQSYTAGAVTYNDGAAWQSAEPTGTAVNVRSTAPMINGSTIVTAANTVTMTNKTLTSPTINSAALGTPKVDQINDALGNPALQVVQTSNGANYFKLTGSAATGSTGYIALSGAGSDSNVTIQLAPKGTGWVELFTPTGTTPKIAANGADSNLNLNLTSKGTGTVQANGVEVATTSAAQALTNKTISGASNTLTNIPPSALTDASRLVATSYSGGTGAEDGGNTWCKLMSIASASQYDNLQVTLAVSCGTSNSHEFAIVSVFFRNNTTGTNPTIDVQMLAKGGTGGLLADDSFRIVHNGWNTPAELWVKKIAAYGQFFVYELTSAKSAAATKTYHSGGWQSATPTATSYVSTNGVVVTNVPVVTTTGTQTLTNKTINSATINSPSLASASFANSTTSGITIGPNTSSTNHLLLGDSSVWLARTPSAGNYTGLAAANSTIWGTTVGDMVLANRKGGSSIIFGTSAADLGEVKRMEIKGDGTITHQATLSASSGTQYFKTVNPTLTQSGTAGYTALLLNAIETSTGSGSKRLIDAQVGYTTKFAVYNDGSVATTGPVSINGNTAVSTVSVPATATSTGTVGQIASDSSYVYVCTATNTWKRAALSTW